MACQNIAWLRFFFAFIWGVAMAEAYLKYKDPKQPVEVRVKDLLSRMTLEEKIGQMTQIDREVASFDVVNKYYIGSVLSGGDSPPFPGATAHDRIKVINEFQKGALSTRLGIPMIYGIDALHGNGNVCNATIFPHNIGLGAARKVAISLHIQTFRLTPSHLREHLARIPRKLFLGKVSSPWEKFS